MHNKICPQLLAYISDCARVLRMSQLCLPWDNFDEIWNTDAKWHLDKEMVKTETGSKKIQKLEVMIYVTCIKVFDSNFVYTHVRAEKQQSTFKDDICKLAQLR